jgi:hypothetical protein
MNRFVLADPVVVLAAAQPDEAAAARARLDDGALWLRGILRHMPGKHDQSSHGRKGPKGAAKAVVEKVAATVGDVLDKPEPKTAKKAPSAVKKAPAKKAPATKKAAPAKKKAAVKKAPAKPKAQTGKAALRAAPLELGKFEFSRGADDEDLAQQLDPESLDFYRGSGYEDINAYLRALGQGEDASDVDPDGDFKATVSAIDFALGHSKLTTPVRVHRGVSGLDAMLPGVDTNRSLIGLEFVEDAYASTTADRRVADGFGGAGVILNVNVPEGVGAIQLSRYYDGDMRGGTPVANQNAKAISNVINEPDFEAELLLESGLKFRVTGDTLVDGRRELDVEVIVP